MNRTQHARALDTPRPHATPACGEGGPDVGSLVGSFATMRAAEDALERLARSSFPLEQISLVARDLESERQVHGFVTTGDAARQGAGADAWFGGLFGVLIGAAFVWVPGFGPLIVAGPLAAALLGSLERAAGGAAGGGLLGALAAWGVSEPHVLGYEAEVRRGHRLLITHGPPEGLAEARELLGGGGAAELREHAPDGGPNGAL